MDKEGDDLKLVKNGNLHGLLTTLQSSMSEIQSTSGKNFLAKDKKNIDNLLKSFSNIEQKNKGKTLSKSNKMKMSRFPRNNRYDSSYHENEHDYDDDYGDEHEHEDRFDDEDNDEFSDYGRSRRGNRYDNRVSNRGGNRDYGRVGMVRGLTTSIRSKIRALQEDLRRCQNQKCSRNRYDDYGDEDEDDDHYMSRSGRGRGRWDREYDSESESD